MSLLYEPGMPPSVSSQEMQAIVVWLMDELNKIAGAIQPQEDLSLLSTDVLPPKPAVRELRWADGTNWNPGGGAGYYEYTGGGVNGWRMLASGTQY